MRPITRKRPTPAEIDALGIAEWPEWSCGVSSFEWEYDQEETSYILEGEATVLTPKDKLLLAPGDLVTFPMGLKCVWEVRKPIRKHYRFG